MKESVFKTSKYLIMVTALLELAISQIHIEMITKLFVVESGFYLFLFILTGLIVTFNLTSMSTEHIGKLNQFVVSTLAAVGSGIYFVILTISDFNTQDNLVVADIRLSLILICLGIAIYLFGGIGIIASLFVGNDDSKAIEA